MVGLNTVIEVDCHFIRDKILSNIIKTSWVNSNNQLDGIFTKPLQGPQINYKCDKLYAYDLYICSNMRKSVDYSHKYEFLLFIIVDLYFKRLFIILRYCDFFFI